MDRPDFLRCETCVGWVVHEDEGKHSKARKCGSCHGHHSSWTETPDRWPDRWEDDWCIRWTDEWPRQAFINEHTKEE